jgi:hypothetical protein
VKILNGTLEICGSARNLFTNSLGEKYFSHETIVFHGKKNICGQGVKY